MLHFHRLARKNTLVVKYKYLREPLKENKSKRKSSKEKYQTNKLGLSCAKLSLASAKLHTSISSDQLKLATH